MNPIKKYEQDIKEHGFQRDPAQEQAVKSLDELFHQFQDYMNTPIPQLTRFQKLLGKKKPTIRQMIKHRLDIFFENISGLDFTEVIPLSELGLDSNLVVFTQYSPAVCMAKEPLE